MKKVISILLTIMMISTTVLADTADDLKEFFVKQSQVRSFAGKSVLNIEVNKPLDILECIPADEDSNVDYALMINDMLDSEVTVNYAYNVSEDYKKLQMYMDCEFDVPVHINDDFKLDAWAKTGIWYNCDFTDEKNPVFEIILKVPFSSDYLVGDIGKEDASDLLSVMNADAIKKTTEAMADSINENATVLKTSKGYKIKFDSDGLGSFLNSWLGILGEYLPKNEKKEFDGAIEEMREIFTQIDFLGDDALTIVLNKNSKGELTACIEEVHIDFNVCDIAEIMGEPMDGIDRNKGQIDITVSTKTEIFGQNKTTVKLPELTDDNTSPLFSEYSGRYYTADMPPLFINDIVYYPINEVIEKSDALVTIEGHKVISGDAVLECNDTQIITVDNETYVTEDVLSFIGVEYVSVGYNFSEKEFEFSFEYMPETYPEDWPEWEEYVPQTLIVEFDIDRDLYTYNNIAYMPVYEFVSEMYEGEFAFGYKSLTYTATKVNVHGIETLTVRDGDKFVLVNGQKIALSSPAKEVNGVLHVPVGFAESYGYSGYVRTTNYTSGRVNTEYFFAMENPMYDSAYEDPYINIWVYSDRLPHVENGEVCVPLYDFLVEMYDGEFSFTDTGMEYAAKGENEFGITKVAVTVGDKFVTVDDRKIELENKVVRINDVIRVPLGFVEALGFETNWISVYDDGTSYSFSMENPKYTE